MHKMQQIKHFLLTKLMNYGHTYLASYALKLLYGNLGYKKFSGGETHESPFKVHPPAKNPGYAYGTDSASRMTEILWSQQTFDEATFRVYNSRNTLFVCGVCSSDRTSRILLQCISTYSYRLKSLILIIQLSVLSLCECPLKGTSCFSIWKYFPRDHGRGRIDKAEARQGWFFKVEARRSRDGHSRRDFYQTRLACTQDR
jgi:hypothetical protein